LRKNERVSLRDGEEEEEEEEEVVKCCRFPMWCISRDEVIFHL